MTQGFESIFVEYMCKENDSLSSKPMHMEGHYVSQTEPSDDSG